MTGRRIRKGSHVLLDTVALVYFLERHPRYGDHARRLFERIETGDLRATIASLVFAELLVPLYRSGDAPMAKRLMSRLRSFRNLDVLDLTAEIGAEAARLRAAYGLRTPDAIHAATGLIGQCDTMVTNDKRLRCLAPEGLEVWLF